MTRSETLSRPFLETLAAALAAILGKAYALFEAYTEARARSMVARELHRMSDHMLRDIGLHRSEIESTVRGARSWY